MDNAPVLMPFQDLPFNGDTYAEKEFLKLKEQYGIKTVVETGSCFYTTTKWFAENFSSVLTVEINAEYAKYGIHKIKDMPNVKPHIADSVDFLLNLPLDVSGNFSSERVLFFLDAHWEESCPLLNELISIASIHSKIIHPPVVVIHDFYTGNPELGYDSYNGQDFTYEWIQPCLRAIEHAYGCEYKHYYNENAEGAKRGIIYIVPNLPTAKNHL